MTESRTGVVFQNLFFYSFYYFIMYLYRILQERLGNIFLFYGFYT